LNPEESEDVFDPDPQFLSSDPPLPPEKMDEFNTTDRPDSDLINLFSQISIPREILERYQGLTLADLSRLNNTASDRRAVELTLIENRNSATGEGDKNVNSRGQSGGMQSENVQLGQPGQPSQQQSTNMGDGVGGDILGEGGPLPGLHIIRNLGLGVDQVLKEQKIWLSFSVTCPTRFMRQPL
jgi:hypothetical protein